MCTVKYQAWLQKLTGRTGAKMISNLILMLFVNSFGIKRIMYGSDWPACLVAASYKKVKEIVDDYFSSFTKNEQEDFFGNNAIEFYNL